MIVNIAVEIVGKTPYLQNLKNRDKRRNTQTTNLEDSTMAKTTKTEKPEPGDYRQMGNPILNVEIQIVGEMPYLQNRVEEETLWNLLYKRKPPKNFVPQGTPRELCEKKVYVSEADDGTTWPYVPKRQFFSSLVGAGKYVRLDGKRQISTKEETILPAFVKVLGTHYPIHIPGQPDKPAPWEVDIQGGRSKTGDLVPILRPRFDAWAFTAHLQIDNAEIQENVIRELVDKAGSRQGLGDFRPMKKGTYGQFKVACWRHI